MMLRGAITGVALALALIALVATTIQPMSWPMLLAAGVLLLGTLGEQWRYQRGQSAHPSDAWRATAECFVDPETGRVVRVLYEPTTGERRYVDGGASPTNP